MSLVCNYAIARFMPYRETGEFVNIGVVLSCPQRGLLMHRFDTKRHSRITHFFSELDIDVYWAAQRAVVAEIDRAGQSLFTFFDRPGYGSDQPEVGKRVFREIIRQRESLIYFSEPGSLISSAPEKALNDLFETYIERQFAKKRDYQEQAMREQLLQMLRNWKLGQYYKHDERLGNEEYSVKFPFIHYRTADDGTGRVASKAIKPLNLNRARNFEIYEHGDKLLSAIARLTYFNSMPEKLIVPVREPDIERQGANAASEIKKELTASGALVIPFEEDAIFQAAKLPLDETA